MDELIVLSGPMKGRHIPIDKDVVRIGRERGCEMVVDDESCSRNHCELYRKDKRLFLRDLKSTNGTFLNDGKVDEAPLRDGDRIGIGDTILVVRSTAATGTKRLPPVVFRDDEGEETRSLRVNLDSTSFLDVKKGVGGAEAAERIAKLYNFSEQLTPVLHRDALLERAMDMIFQAIPADRGILVLADAGGALATRVVRKREGVDLGEDIAISKTLSAQVLEKKESFLTVDAEADGRLSTSESIRDMHVRSAICAPLKVRDRVLGLIYLDTLGHTRPFGQLDLQLLTAMALHTTLCLENARLYEELMDAVEYGTGILRGLNSGIVVADTTGTVTQVNETALEILRLSELALIKHRLSSHEGLEEMAEVVERTLVGGASIDRSEVRIRVGGEEVPLGLSTSLLRDHQGLAVGVIANFRNLSAIRRLEEQVKRSQHLASLGQMAAGVAHEIRNPLNSIRGFTQLLQENPGEEKVQEYATIVLEEVDRMNNIVQGLLDFSRQRELTLVTTDVADVVKDLLEEMKPEMEAARVAVDFAKEGDLPPILGSGDKLRQVFRNIVANAVDAMPEGGTLTVRLRPRVGPDEEEGQRREVAVSVTDTGTGIASDVLPRIFDPFFTNKEVGTGLGLAISQKIVDQHGGRIDVETQAGSGSTFTVVLPAL